MPGGGKMAQKCQSALSALVRASKLELIELHREEQCLEEPARMTDGDLWDSLHRRHPRGFGRETDADATPNV